MDALLTCRDLSSVVDGVCSTIEGFAGKLAAASDAMLEAVGFMAHAGLGGAVLPPHITPLFFMACYDHGSVLDDLTELAKALARGLTAAREHARVEIQRGLVRFVDSDWEKVPLESSRLPAALGWLRELPDALRTDPEAGCIAEAMVHVAVKVLEVEAGATGFRIGSDPRAKVRVTAGNLPSAKKANATAQLIAGLLLALGELPVLESAAAAGQTASRAARAGLELLALRDGAEACSQQDVKLSLLVPLVCALKVPARPGDADAAGGAAKPKARPSVASRIWGMADNFAVVAAQEQRVFSTCEAGELADLSATELVVHSAPLVDRDWAEWSLLGPSATNASAALRIAKAAVSGSAASVDTLLPPEGGQSPAMSRVVETFVRREGSSVTEKNRNTQLMGVAVLWVLSRRLRSVVASVMAAATAHASSTGVRPPPPPVRARGFLPRPGISRSSGAMAACRLGIGLNALASSGEVAFFTGVGAAPWSGYAGQCMLLTSMVGACGILLTDGRMPSQSCEDPECIAPVRLSQHAYRLLNMARAPTLPVSSVEVRNWGAAVAAARIGFAGVWAGQHTNHNAMWLSADEVDERFRDVERVALELPASLAGGGFADGGVATSLVHRMGAHPQLAAHLVRSAYSLLEAVQELNPLGGTGVQTITMALFAAVVWGFADPEFPWHLVDAPSADDELASMIASLVSNGCAVWAGSSAGSLPSRGASLQASVYGLSEELVQTCLASMLKAEQVPKGSPQFERDFAAQQRARLAAESFSPPEPISAEELGPMAVSLSKAIASSSCSGSGGGSGKGGESESSYTSDQVSTLTAFMSENCGEAVRELTVAIQPDMGRFVERTLQQCFGAKVPLMASANNAGQLVETALQLQAGAGARPGLKMEVVATRLQRAVERLDVEAWLALRPTLLDRMRMASTCMLRASLAPAAAVPSGAATASSGAGAGAMAADLTETSTAATSGAGHGAARGAASADIVSGRASADTAAVPEGEHATWAVPLRLLCQAVGASLRSASESPDDDDETEAEDRMEHRSWKAIEASPLLGRGWTCGYDEPGYGDVDAAAWP